jgi:hypothetical protein
MPKAHIAVRFDEQPGLQLSLLDRLLLLEFDEPTLHLRPVVVKLGNWVGEAIKRDIVDDIAEEAAEDCIDRLDVPVAVDQNGADDRLEAV